MLDVPVLMSTLSTLPALFKHPHRDAKWGKEAAFKGSIWLWRIFHWCIVTGDFSSPALQRRTGSETEPDVRVFTDSSPRPDVLLLYWQQRRQRLWWWWRRRRVAGRDCSGLLWHADSNDNDFYGSGINNRWGWWLKKVAGKWIIQLGVQVHTDFDLFFFWLVGFCVCVKTQGSKILKSKVMKELWTCPPTSTSFHNLIMGAAECLIAPPVRGEDFFDLFSCFSTLPGFSLLHFHHRVSSYFISTSILSLWKQTNWN